MCVDDALVSLFSSQRRHSNQPSKQVKGPDSDACGAGLQLRSPLRHPFDASIDASYLTGLSQQQWGPPPYACG